VASLSQNPEKGYKSIGAHHPCMMLNVLSKAKLAESVLRSTVTGNAITGKLGERCSYIYFTPSI
jgi:hypothetical protein